MDKKRNLLEDRNDWQFFYWQLNSKEQERYVYVMEGLRLIPGTLFNGLIPYWAFAYAKKANIPCLALSYIIADDFIKILYSVSPLKGGESKRIDEKLEALHEGEKSGKLMKDLCEMLEEVWKFRDDFVHANKAALEKYPERQNDVRLEHSTTLLKYCLASAYSVRISDTPGEIDLVFPELWEIDEQGRANVNLMMPTTTDLGWFDRHILRGSIKDGPVEIVECPS